MHNDRLTKPDFELIYRLEQEHRELIECQSRKRSSTDIADKIRNAKSLSSRNRYVFGFEDPAGLAKEHQRVLQSDGINCLSFAEFELKIDQLDVVVSALRRSSIETPGPLPVPPENVIGSIPAWRRAVCQQSDLTQSVRNLPTPRGERRFTQPGAQDSGGRERLKSARSTQAARRYVWCRPPLTVSLAGATVRLRGQGTPQASFDDVNADGLLDLVVHVETQALELSENDTEVDLTASADENAGGVADTIIRGFDTVHVVP